MPDIADLDPSRSATRQALIASAVALRRKLVESGASRLFLHQGFNSMRICVFGAGAVGSHIAVRLAQAGHDVSCVMRGPHLDAVKANGLTLRVGDAAFTAKVKASDDPADLGPQDVVISTLKPTPAAALPTPPTPLINPHT